MKKSEKERRESVIEKLRHQEIRDVKELESPPSVHWCLASVRMTAGYGRRIAGSRPAGEQNGARCSRCPLKSPSGEQNEASCSRRILSIHAWT